MVSQSTGSNARLDRLDRLVLGAAIAASSVWCLTTARALGATFDEPFYLEAGLDAWRTGYFRELLAAGTMPLPAHLQTLPLYLRELSTGQRWATESDIGVMLPIARSVTLVFWCLLLTYSMRLAHAIGGRWAGRVAVLLIALDPNFLAHAGLATSDIAVAAGLVMFAFYYRDGRDGLWPARIGWPAVAFAVAMSAKASALTFGPMVFVAVEFERRSRGVTGRKWLGDGAQVFALGALLAIVYCGPGGGPSFQGTLARMPESYWLRPALQWLGALPLSPNGFYALWFQADHNRFGQPTYLMGYESARALWFYVPLLPLVKFPLPTLLLIVWAVISHRPRLKLVAGLAAIVVLLMVMVRVQTGIRFLLPLAALLMAAIAVWMVASIGRLHPAGQRKAVAGLVVLLTWMAVGDLRAWPDPLRYANELWGGPANGYTVVSDSNYDWGQGLPELAAWQADRNVPVLVWYFGTDPRFPQIRRVDPRREQGVTGNSARYLAVSTSLLYGGYLTQPGPGRDLMLKLRAIAPAARTRTFLIYDAAAYAPGDAGR